jgi:membrane protein DedA with SNARE-associated domain
MQYLPLLLLLIEEAGMPIFIPGDAILAFTGYSVQSSQHASLLLAFAIATVAVLCGASILFFVARRYGQTVIEKLGRFIFLKQRHLERAEQLFKRYGVWTIIFGRHIPGMRIPITIFAATSGVRYMTFILSTFVSTVLWIWLYLFVGRRYSASIKHLLTQSFAVTAGVVAIIVLAIIGLHIYGNGRRESNQ